jgi:nitroimidazol reductase NimA-like FMN-containing flavoprotein (pyridoxamine 5'-phosphate oxidase superfamily)
MSHYPKTDLNTVHRLAKRAHYDAETIHAIIDSAYICHVGFADEQGQPFVVPTIHARHEDTIYLHGSKSSRMLNRLGTGIPVCLTFTHLDGLVLARSTFHSSMNYRSAMVFGTGREVTERAEKLLAMEYVSEHLMVGRWNDTRPTTAKEVDATSIVAIQIESASAKVRTGGAMDDEEDYALPLWAGVVPVVTTLGTPIDDERLLEGVRLPEYIQQKIAEQD